MFDELNAKSQSPIESAFLKACVRAGLRVEPQYKIGPIHADFAVPYLRLVIECDSKEFHSSADALRTDDERDRIYEKNEWNVLRISGHAILKDADRIANAIKARTLRAGIISYPLDEEHEYVSTGPYFEPEEKEIGSNLKPIGDILKARYGIAD